MLNGIRIFTSDEVWRTILSDMGAEIAPDGLDFDRLKISIPITTLELKSAILSAIDSRNKKIIGKLCGRDAQLSDIQARIVIALVDAPRTMSELKNILGFAPDVATHSADTAIYNLRKIFGRDFIKFENGKYYIGV